MSWPRCTRELTPGLHGARRAPRPPQRELHFPAQWLHLDGLLDSLGSFDQDGWVPGPSPRVSASLGLDTAASVTLMHSEGYDRSVAELISSLEPLAGHRFR